MPVIAAGFGDDERSRDAARKRHARTSARDIEIPEPFDPIRRRDCLADPYEFLPTYMPDKFPGRWTADRRRIVDEIMYRIEYGGKKALAAPRGKGKTSIAEGVVGVFAPLKGLLRFPLIVGATGQAADQILANIKWEFERNPILAMDFPEVCIPILALEGWSSRARMQTVGGKRTFLEWCSDHVVLPTVEGSIASGCVLATRSIDGAIRGLRVGNQRPDFVLIDDMETRDSARSATECEKREATVEKDIGGLGGAGKEVSTLYLSTVQNCTCASFRYTDPKQKPAYAGERISAVDAWPADEEAWSKYVEMRKEDMEGGDVEARRSHQFYLDNRESMDAGVVMADEDWFDATELADGSVREVSAIQHVYNIVADRNWSYVLTELQNDPPADETDESDKLTPYVVRGSAPGYTGRMTGMPPGQIPAGSLCVTAFIDINDAFLTWEVCAWGEKRRCTVVDYGKQKTDSRSTVGLDKAIVRALNDIREDFEKKGYRPDLTLIDSGDGRVTDLVYNWCRAAGGSWFPSKGDGRYTAPKGKDGKRQEHLHFHFTSLPALLPKQLIVMDSDHWKTEAHEALKASPLDKNGEHAAGAVRLFGVEPLRHTDFAEEVCAEQFVREFIEGKPALKEGWVRKSKANHWFDTHYGNYAAHAVVELWQRVKNTPQRRFGVLSKGV